MPRRGFNTQRVACCVSADADREEGGGVSADTSQRSSERDFKQVAINVPIAKKCKSLHRVTIIEVCFDGIQFSWRT